MGFADFVLERVFHRQPRKYLSSSCSTIHQTLSFASLTTNRSSTGRILLASIKSDTNVCLAWLVSNKKVLDMVIR